jgi:hypothetical protein
MSKQVKIQFPSGQNYEKSFNPIIDEDANEARLLNNMTGRPQSAPARLQSGRASRRNRSRTSRRGRGRTSRRGRGRASRRNRGRGQR